MKLWDKVLKNVIMTKGQEWVLDNAVYVVMTGSHAYGTNRSDSDYDIYGVTVPTRPYIYPHEFGFIPDFHPDVPRFEQFQKQGFVLADCNNKEVDLTIYNIVKYFRLCADGNPNMIDTLFVPDNCILHMTECGELIRSFRLMFLSKKCKHRFMGYAFSQMKKIRSRTNCENPFRQELIKKYGYDTKFAGHLVRLVYECEQILMEGTLDLQRNREKLKRVFEGEYTIEELEKWFHGKEEYIDDLYHKSDLPYEPQWINLGKVLQSCIDLFYGDNLK